ncbi:MAG: conjugal transfer protein TrbC [Kineosporiaceae bacterium]
MPVASLSVLLGATLAVVLQLSTRPASSEPVTPSSGFGVRPPGFEAFAVILQWATWISLTLCVLGVIITGAMMALGSRRGEGAEHAMRLGWVLAAAVVIASASALVGALV